MTLSQRSILPGLFLLSACTGGMASSGGMPAPGVDSGAGSPDTSARQDGAGEDTIAQLDVVVIADAGSDAVFDTPEVMLVNPNALFVSTTGDNGNDGRTREAAFRTIAHAASLAVAGETIYVEAGTYIGENVEFGNQGEDGAPITLEGYETDPGDRPSFETFNASTAFDPTRMPLLDGGDRADGGVAVTLHGDYHIARNLQITNYVHGIYGYAAQHAEVHQTYLSTFGVNDREVYSGKGIVMGSMADSCVITDSVVINAGAESIMLYANNSRISGSAVYGNYANGNLNGPDYYMFIQGDGNVIEDSLVQREGDLWHGGHGFTIKGAGENNVIRNNRVVGIRGDAYQLRHRGVVNNLLQNNSCLNCGSALTFRDGASNNIVEGHMAEGSIRGISFFDTSEDDGRHYSGNDNTVRDSVFMNTTLAPIALHDYIYNDVYARRNTIEDVVFDGAPFLFDVRSFGENNVLRNSTIRNVDTFARFHNGRTNADIGFTFEGITEEDNGFELP